MGYESRIYFCREYDSPEPIHHSSILAMIDMSKIGYSSTFDRFLRCFDTETEFSIYILGCDKDGNEVMVDEIEDMYGARIKYASDTEKLYRIATQMAEENKYRQFDLLKAMIEIAKESPDIKIVHYGH